MNAIEILSLNQDLVQQIIIVEDECYYFVVQVVVYSIFDNHFLMYKAYQ